MQLRPLTMFASMLVVLSGCGSGSDIPTDPLTKPIPPDAPAADSPAHLIERMELTWERKDEASYALLLTSDFRYHFSPAADPLLADLYGDNWSRIDEMASITHLFHGFTNSNDVQIPAASRIDLTLSGVSVGQDFEHPDSTVHYRKCVITTLDATIEVPDLTGVVTYQIGSRHELYLVRGDAGLVPPGASADSTRWYVRRWDDMAANTSSKFPVINPLSASTLGKLRATFR